MGVSIEVCSLDVLLGPLDGSLQEPSTSKKVMTKNLSLVIASLSALLPLLRSQILGTIDHGTAYCF